MICRTHNCNTEKYRGPKRRDPKNGLNLRTTVADCLNSPLPPWCSYAGDSFRLIRHHLRIVPEDASLLYRSSAFGKVSTKSLQPQTCKKQKEIKGTKKIPLTEREREKKNRSKPSSAMGYH